VNKKNTIPTIFLLVLILQSLLIPAQAQLPTDFIPSNIDTNFIKYLDYEWRTIHSINIQGKHYDVKQVSNYIPFVNGIQVYDNRGNQVTSTNTVQQVFEIVGWIEAGKRYSSSDLNTLKNILTFSNEINAAIAPINSDISSVLGVVDTLQNDLCIDLIVYRGCAWDLVESQIPGISIIASVVRELNNELTDWSKATLRIRQELPSTIRNIEDLKFNQQVNIGLEREIRDGISALDNLKRQSNDLTSDLWDISGYLRAIENTLYDASDLPFIGNTIYNAGVYFGNLNSEVVDFRNDVNQVSSILSSQSQKLNQIIFDADNKANELFGSWNARQNALPFWNMMVMIGGLVLLILVIVIPIAAARKRRR